MTTYAKLRTDAVVLNPVAPASVPNNSIFLDNNNDAISNKNNSGGVADQSSPVKKLMQSGQVAAIPAGRPISKLPNGKIIEADSDAVNAQNFVGITLEVFSALDEIKMVLLVGPNAPGVIASLGFTPGEEIFLDEAGGYTNTTSAFSGDNDSIIKLGVADCTEGAASGTATDLILFPEVIARP